MRSGVANHVVRSKAQDAGRPLDTEDQGKRQHVRRNGVIRDSGRLLALDFWSGGTMGLPGGGVMRSGEGLKRP